MVVMDFAANIKEGMQKIIEGCHANGEWNLCDMCPLTEICDDIMRANDGMTPAEVFEIALDNFEQM